MREFYYVRCLAAAALRAGDPAIVEENLPLGIAVRFGAAASGEAAGQEGLSPGFDEFATLYRRGHEWRTLTLRIEYASPHAMPAAAFVDLILVQPSSMRLVERALQLCNESRAANGEELFHKAEFPAALALPVHADFYAFILESLLEELQIEAALVGDEFVVPDEFRPWLEATPALDEPHGGEGEAEEPGEAEYDGSDLDYVYLYSLGSPTGSDLLELIAAQAMAIDPAEALRVAIAEAEADGNALTVSAEAVPIHAALLPDPGGLAGLDAVTVSAAQLDQLLLRGIALITGDAGVNVTIPPSLADLFGPDDDERRRIRLRSGWGRRWLPLPSEAPRRTYLLETHPLPHSFVPPPAATLHSRAIGGLMDALMSIADFARREVPPWTVPFETARALLAGVDARSPLEPGLRDPGEAIFVQALMARGLDAGSAALLADEARRLEKLFALRRDQGVLVLLAVSLADVFGGMGSWNDIGAAMYHPDYGRVSAALYDSLSLCAAVSA